MKRKNWVLWAAGLIGLLAGAAVALRSTDAIAAGVTTCHCPAEKGVAACTATCTTPQVAVCNCPGRCFCM